MYINLLYSRYRVILPFNLKQLLFKPPVEKANLGINLALLSLGRINAFYK